MRVAFHTLGCKVNRYETDLLKDIFSRAGYEVFDADQNPAAADIYIINSCTVTSQSDSKVRKLLRRIKREHPAALAVLTGCMPQAYPGIADALPEADVITGSKNRAGLINTVERALTSGGRVVEVEAHTRDEGFEDARGAGGDRTRAYVKIQDGCNRYCSYCIIPTARGPVRSKPLESFKTELADLAAAGYREVVLVGINLSLYGSEIGLRLADAAEAAELIPGIDRVRLGSLEPELLTEEDILRLAACKKLCPHFHLSLQSGSAGVLKRMRRQYGPEEFADIVKLLRTHFTDPALTTDIIAGFPGETQREFEETLEFVERIKFSAAHIFGYSVRAGTKAADMPNRVPAPVIRERVAGLIRLTDTHTASYYSSKVGTRADVLFEHSSIPGRAFGHTADYIPVSVRSDTDLCGQILPVQIVSAGKSGAEGRLV